MRAYERLLRYAAVNTTSDEANENETPSSPREWDLAGLLQAEMKEIGLQGVFTDEHCYVYGFLPATPGYENALRVGFNAHLDTVDDVGGTDTHPMLIPDYDGSDIPLGGSGRVLKPADFPHLKDCVGKTIITTDGTSVLGADDKAGIAEIMTMAETLIREKIPHGSISVCFSPDEEIGHGAAYLDIEKFGADYAYTMDGSAPDELECETFNAASAAFYISGVSVHPGSAKGKMLNAVKLAMEINAMLPENEVPEKTEGREGFYHLTGISGSVSEAEIHYIIRDHDAEKFAKKKEGAAKIADLMNQKYGAGTVKVDIRDQYRNMAEILKDHPAVVEYAKRAIKEEGLTPVMVPVRGGTDGAQLSFRGLPCPNLGTGGYAYHGYYEHAVAEEMDSAVRILLNLVSAYAESRRAE